MQLPFISVVIPVYKAESCLLELYTRLSKSLSEISTHFEIILVEDCGGDHSWEKITTLAKNDKRVKGMQFSRNFGQHYGITAGLDVALGEWVVVMDCDLQDAPEEIPRLYAKAQEGYDIVLASRTNRQDKFLKKLSSRMFYRMLSYLADTEYDGSHGNFRIMSKKVVDTFKTMREQLRFFGGLVQWMGFPTTSLDVIHHERFVGQSSYTFKKLFKLATDTVIAFSDKPLRVAVKLGFLMSFLSFAYGTYIFAHAFFYGSSVQGWSSLIVSMYFIGGIIISMLGVIGIYLGKAFDQMKNRPLYIVRRTTFHE
ncbi:MAG: glycosyltransferase [Methylophilus methylotrophus]|uniref:Glycosyltransferase n=1 Tax=Methylophilus methylotrophus TaxID=17 RepID=A0A5C7WP18_METME|nr:MAG: glycosyltransferase [Methylophilus methylotrophus]